MPYPNEHACRLREPGDFQEGSFRSTTRESDGKEYRVIVGRLTGEETTTEQAYRYDKDEWGEGAARSHCQDHDGSFEPAAESEEASVQGFSMDVEKLKELYIVILAKGVSGLEGYDTLRLLDNELEAGVKALYDDDGETIVAFCFSRGSYTEDEAREWVATAEKSGVNLSLKAQVGRRKGRRQPTFSLQGGKLLGTAVEDLSFGDISGLLAELLEGMQTTGPDGMYRFPWLVDVYVDHCIVALGMRYYRIPYDIDDANQVTLGEPVEVRREWMPIAPSNELAAGVVGQPMVFSIHLEEPRALPAEISGQDGGLLWKEVFRTGTTFRPVTGDALTVEQPMIDGMADAFDAGVFPMVPITSSTHYEESGGIIPAKDTDGFVKRVLKAGGSLYAGLDVISDDVRERIEDGRIKGCSVFVWFDVHDRKQKNKTWPFVLVHLLLTNYPQLPDLAEFGVVPEALAASFTGVGCKHYVEEDDMTDKQKPQGADPQLQPAAISPEDAAILAKAKALEAAGYSLDGAVERQTQLRQKARKLEIDSIVAALEGRADRGDVVVVEGTRHFPAIVAAVEQALRGGEGFDVSDDGIGAADALVLSVANAIPKEGRLALEGAPARPRRAEPQGPPPRTHRTEPLPPEQLEKVSDEQVDQFRATITGRAPAAAP